MTAQDEILPDGPWLDWLNPDFIRAAYPSWACITEGIEPAAAAFRLYGFSKLAAIDTGLQFDAAYYRETNPAWEGSSDLACYKHWLMEGLATGRHGSAEAHLKALALSLSSYPAAFAWEYYVRLRPQAGAHRWAALDDFCAYGFNAYHEVFPYGPEAFGFLLALGHKFSITEDRLAIRAYELAQSYRALPPTEFQHLADSYLREQLWRPAIELYSKIIADGQQNGWTVLNFVKCAINLAQWPALLTGLERARHHLAKDPLWPVIIGEAMEGLFISRTASARALMAAGAYVEADDLIVKIIDNLAILAERLNGSATRPHGQADKILILANNDDPARAERSVLEKSRLLTQLGIPHEAASYAQAAQYSEALSNVAAVILFRTPAFPAIIQFILAARTQGVAVFFESDTAEINPDYSPTLESFRGKITGPSYDGLRFGLRLEYAAAQLCDFAIAPDKNIAGVLRSLVRNRRCFVIPNSVLPEDLPEAQPTPAVPREPGQVKMFLHQPSLAYLDAQDDTLGGGLFKVLQQMPDITLCIHGPIHLDPRFDMFTDRLLHAGGGAAPLDYWPLLAETDINLILACESPDALYLGERSWAEAASYGVPSILLIQNGLLPDIRDGANAMRAASLQTWLTAITQLIQDAELRERLGAQAKLDAPALQGKEAAIAALELMVTEAVAAGDRHVRYL